ncbi:MAG: hypothetical protein C0524_18445 [Rhodobacter sp.]|nr:hypothetical protein [Rhodobacter sp.]
MRVFGVSSVLLVGFLTIGAASGQTTPPAADPHHAATDEGAVAPAEADATQQPVAPGDAGMGAMMSPEMMQMMMQMMAQHHPAGQMPMAGMEAMQPDMAKGPGPEMILGLGASAVEEMTPEKVQTLLQDQLARLGNPRLKLGEIGVAPDGSITAEIRTVDGALVQKLAFNRYPGFVRQID